LTFHKGSAATRLRCGVIFSYITTTNFILILTVKKIVKIGQYLTEVIRHTIMCEYFWVTLHALAYTVNRRSNNQFDKQDTFLHESCTSFIRFCLLVGIT